MSFAYCKYYANDSPRTNQYFEYRMDQMILFIFISKQKLLMQRISESKINQRSLVNFSFKPNSLLLVGENYPLLDYYLVVVVILCLYLYYHHATVSSMSQCKKKFSCKNISLSTKEKRQKKNSYETFIVFYFLILKFFLSVLHRLYHFDQVHGKY